MSTSQGKFLAAAAVLLTAAASMTVYVMLQAAAWSVNPGTILFIAWAISPYACFFAASRLILKLSPSSDLGIPTLVVAALMLAFTLYVYVGTMGDPSSTYALIFIFVPLYLYIGSFFLLSIIVLISRLLKRKRGER
jgi:hypothetical protein